MLWLLSYVGAWFSLMTIVIIGKFAFVVIDKFFICQVSFSTVHAHGRYKLFNLLIRNGPNYRERYTPTSLVGALSTMKSCSSSFSSAYVSMWRAIIDYYIFIF